MNHFKHCLLSSARYVPVWTLCFVQMNPSYVSCWVSKEVTKSTQRTPRIVVGNLNDSFKLRTEKARAAEVVGQHWSQLLAWAAAFKNKLYLFMSAVLGLCCCTDFSLVAVSSGCSSWQCGGLSLQWLLLLWALGYTSFRLRFLGSRAQAQRLWHTGLVAPRYVESFWARDRTCVSCIGRWILHHSATREALELQLLWAMGPGTGHHA